MAEPTNIEDWAVANFNTKWTQELVLNTIIKYSLCYTEAEYNKNCLKGRWPHLISAYKIDMEKIESSLKDYYVVSGMNGEEWYEWADMKKTTPSSEGGRVVYDQEYKWADEYYLHLNQYTELTDWLNANIAVAGNPDLIENFINTHKRSYKRACEYYNEIWKQDKDTTEDTKEEEKKEEPKAETEAETDATKITTGELISEGAAIIGTLSETIRAFDSYVTNAQKNLSWDGLLNIFGLPYQFSEIVDPPKLSDTVRSDSAHVGKKFADKVLSLAPILFISPGEPKLLGGLNKSMKTYWTTRIVNTILASGDDENEEEVEMDEGQFYTFHNTFSEYAKYVNTAARSLAIFLNIQDKTIPLIGQSNSTTPFDIESWFDIVTGVFPDTLIDSLPAALQPLANEIKNLKEKSKSWVTKLTDNAKSVALEYWKSIYPQYDETKNGNTDTTPGEMKLGEFDIYKLLNNNYVRACGHVNTIPFFLDAETNISDSYSNSTTESMFAGMTKGFSDKAKEIEFLIGNESDGTLLRDAKKLIGDVAGVLGEAAGDVATMLGGKNMLSNMVGELTTIVNGGKIVFPEIWSDSSYSKSYSIRFKFTAADPDPLSIFINVYLPMIVLVSMAAPRQRGASSNAFDSPFLIRATYKSIFNCNLGIIDSLSIDRGGEGNWNEMGMSTSADVSINIKDLYETFFISKKVGIIANTAQIDYLAMLAGNDLNLPDIFRVNRLLYNMLENAFITDFPNEIQRRFSSKLNEMFNATMSFFRFGYDNGTVNR